MGDDDPADEGARSGRGPPMRRESTPRSEEEGFQSGMMGRSSIMPASRCGDGIGWIGGIGASSSFLRLFPAPSGALIPAPGETTGDADADAAQSSSSLTETFLTMSVSSSMFLVMEAIRCFNSCISVLRWVTSSGFSFGLGAAGRTEEEERTAEGGALAPGAEDGAAEEEDEDDEEGVRLISVRRSFRPLRNLSWRNLQNLAVSASNLWSILRELENLTLRNP
mmetsp:Transcript_16138/g.34055  ORF Transcript_16138/g.34055 Transcript_16138/m.34055 type:complete len:223 (+) Transcript_16138:1058-1726(+)